MQRACALALVPTLLSFARSGSAAENPTLDALYAKEYATKLKPYTPKKFPDRGLKDDLGEKGRRARGYYLTAYWLAKFGAERAAKAMKAAHMNAVVFDVKDDWGSVHWASEVPLAKRVQSKVFKDLGAVVKTFHEHGIYVIVRMVCFKDSRLPVKRPDLAVRTGKGGAQLYRSRGAGWVDVYSAELQDYLVELSVELEGLGVDEIQYDYIRFPHDSEGGAGQWLHQDKRTREQVVAGFLEKLDRALKIPISVDIFGLTTWVDGDPRRIGQTVEVMARYVEALSPMMYANGMHTYFPGGQATEGVYELIHCGLWRARRRVPGVVLRPYLQAYPDGVRSFWGATFIHKQLEAARKAGIDGFLFWNSSMKNGVSYRALKQLGLAAIDELGARPEDHLKPENWPRGRWCKKADLVKALPQGGAGGSSGGGGPGKQAGQ
ncbi:MAG: hypothetical protein IT371_31265 [Deltaproteobacteria bacterium]|nr:hypothetical protein [Deltaproteobacteria bacterium]